jgi:hypothetical protein
VAKGCLDEELASVLFGGDETILPSDVSSHPFADGTFGEPFDLDAHDAEGRIFGQSGDLSFESRRVAEVVTIHASDQRAAGGLKSVKQGANDAHAGRVEATHP